MAVADNGGTRDSWLSLSRKVAFWAGLLGVGYETVFEDVDRPWLFLVFLTMMGLAQFGRVFELLSNHDHGGFSIHIGKGGDKKPDADSEEGGGPP